jgi:hypothetical protein
MSDQALARLRDVLRCAMDLHGHDVKEAIEAISLLRDKWVNGRLQHIPIRSFEHYIARTDSDLRQPSRPVIRAIAQYAGVDPEKLIRGVYVVDGGAIWIEA